MTHPEPTPLETLTLAHFEPLLDQPFEMTAAGEAFTLVLVEACALRNFRPDAPTRAPFTLLFRCADRRILPQASYVMSNPNLGQRELFIVPVGSDGAGVRYEALFN